MDVKTGLDRCEGRTVDRPFVTRCYTKDVPRVISNFISSSLDEDGSITWLEL